MTKRLGILALSAYIIAILLANYLTDHYGFVSMGFGQMATAGTFAAGAALLLRDAVHETLGRNVVLAGIAVGAGLTYVISPALAFASAAAFLLAELADMAVYTPLREKGWVPAVIASNIVGAIVDTWVFLWLANFAITEDAFQGQLTGKLFWATLVPVVLVVGARRVHKALNA